MGRSFCLAGALIAACVAVAPISSAQKIDRTLTLTAAAPAAEVRHALVVGNNAYPTAPLRNPVNDARAIARALRDVGFNVMLVEDGSQLATQRAIRTFGDNIAKGGVGLFYFAGHGMQVRGKNFLIPVNAEIAREDEIEFTAIDVNLVLAKMDSAKNPLNIVILDACRNNPFGRGFRSAQAGLAQVDAPTGSFIAFATAPGSVAADGAGENGVYTKYLLAEMARPGVPIEQLFKQVRIGVMTETAGRQIPWESSSLRGEFTFRPAPQLATVPTGASAAEVERIVAAALAAQRKDSEAVELAFWESVRTSSDAAEYHAYLEQYPQGKFSSLARNRIASLGQKPVAPPVKPVAQEPTVVASIAPPAPPSSNGMPAQGDSWTYNLTVRSPPYRKSTYVARVQGTTRDAILEDVQVGEEIKQWAHSRGAALVNLNQSVFTPYAVLMGELRPGMRLQIDNNDARTCGTTWSCQLSGRVVGYETVRVPAGTFQAMRVEIVQSWISQGATNDRSEIVNRTLNVWYAAESKRAVKFSSRGARSAFIDTDFDLELVSSKAR